jgi:hypothetical protein
MPRLHVAAPLTHLPEVHADAVPHSVHHGVAHRCRAGRRARGYARKPRHVFQRRSMDTCEGDGYGSFSMLSSQLLGWLLITWTKMDRGRLGLSGAARTRGRGKCPRLICSGVVQPYTSKRWSLRCRLGRGVRCCAATEQLKWAPPCTSTHYEYSPLRFCKVPSKQGRDSHFTQSSGSHYKASQQAQRPNMVLGGCYLQAQSQQLLQGISC